MLSLVQAAVVALAGKITIPWLERRRSRLWAAIPPLSVIAFVFVARAAERASAQSLTYLALLAVPLLAALALGWWGRGARPVLALSVPVLFALAWADRAGLAGPAAATALSALSCVALGVLLAAVTPPRWLAAGIVLMACADAVLVVSELLQHPNEALNAAHPAAGLPKLQAEAFGSAAMGYGDLFVAGLLGGLLARGWPSARMRQTHVAALVALLALAFDLLFFFVAELPATVPVAVGLLIAIGLARKRERKPAGSDTAGGLAREATERVTAPGVSV
ncbi:MAG TPA: hypothetical protein VNV37_02960 [Solirubrobacteraceae bacterium]|nr:hypothetical protein [Solirubrobacteraceae bacterium]